jgi:hypothetical protein
MDAAAYQSDQYSPVVCPASFSDLLAASQVVACTVYNTRDSINAHNYLYTTAAHCGLQGGKVRYPSQTEYAFLTGMFRHFTMQFFTFQIAE